MLARVHAQNKNLRHVNLRVFSLHALARARRTSPYEFGVKVYLATTLNRSKGGQVIVRAKDRGYGTRTRWDLFAPREASIVESNLLAIEAC